MQKNNRKLFNSFKIIIILITIIFIENVKQDEIRFIDFKQKALSNDLKNISMVYKINNNNNEDAINLERTTTQSTTTIITTATQPTTTIIRTTPTTTRTLTTVTTSGQHQSSKNIKSKVAIIKKAYDTTIRSLENYSDTIDNKIKKNLNENPFINSSIYSSSSSSSHSSKIPNNNGQDSMNIKQIQKSSFKNHQIDKMLVNSNEDPIKISNNFLNSDIFHFQSNKKNTTRSNTNNYDVDTFKTIVKLFDHYNWQINELQSKISKNCTSDMNAYLLALKMNIEWAQKAYDSSGRYRGQFFYRNVIWIGEKRFCEEINLQNRQNPNKKEQHLEFEFFSIRCKIQYPGLSDSMIQLGECLPKSCSINDVGTILKLDPSVKILNQQELNLSAATVNNTAAVQIIEVRQIPSGKYSLFDDLIFQGLCGTCLLLIFIILIATIYESTLSSDTNDDKKFISKISTKNSSNKIKQIFTIHNIKEQKSKIEIYHMNGLRESNNNNVIVVDDAENGIEKKSLKSDEKRHKLGIHQKLLLCFSLKSNCKVILSLEGGSQEDNISCLHGIRVLSLFWIIMVHTYLQVFQIGENRYLRNISERAIIYQVIGNATFSVDSFFFISGLLVCLLFLKNHKTDYKNVKQFISKGSSECFMMIFYRYVRLTPVYLFIILLHHVTVKYVLDNSVLQPPTNVMDHITCAKYWWRNILYINNWYPFKDLCMIWSWYLSNDMQFYILAIIILIISTKHFKTSVLTFGTLLILSWGTSGFFSLFYNYTHKVSHPFESFDFLYDKPWQRIGSYVIGMATGYIIQNTKSPPKISILLNILLWFISISTLFIIVFGVWDGELGLLSTAFYVSIGHSAWGLGLVWITLSCCWKLSNPINNFLSYRGFLPFSRLTYCMYLIHPTIMIAICNHMEGSIHLDHILIFIIFLGNISITFLIAIVISLIFEVPIKRILKLVF